MNKEKVTKKRRELFQWSEKMYAVTIFVTLTSLIAMVAYNYIIFHSNAVGSMEEIGVSNLSRVTEELEGYLSNGKNVLQTTAATIEYMLQKGASLEEVEDFLRYKTERYSQEVDKNFNGIYGVINDVYVDGSDWVPEADYVPEEREWYLTAREAGGEVALVSPYLDAQTGNIMMSVSVLLSDMKSVISLDIALDEIQKITENISLNGMGYGFVVDRKGMVVAHKDAGEKGKSYWDDSDMEQLLGKMYEEALNCFETRIDGEKYTVFADSVMEDWYVVMVVSNSKLFYDVNISLMRNTLICGAISSMIVFFYVYTTKKMEQSVQLEWESARKIEQMNKSIIRALVRTIDAKDRYTNGHSLRVADYAKEIARRMGKTPEDQEKIYYAGLLHDVGKIRIIEEVINKPDRLTDEEYEQIKIHPVIGYQILKDIYEDKDVALGAKLHHERFDGRGYPNGLKGENIPEIARIIGVADSYDAMASNRSYRRALPQNVVRREIALGKGTQFDPEIADIMLQMIDEDREYKLKETGHLQKTILVVDDELMNVELISAFLKDEPMYKVISASDGREALEKLKETKVNLILLDVMMPGMDGFETLACIRERMDVPVVFMTGDKQIETIQRATELGVEDYITKPVRPLVLKEILHSIFSMEE